MATMTTPAARPGDTRSSRVAPVLARAGQIEPTGEDSVSNSPFFGRMHSLSGARGTSNVVGATDLVAARRLLPWACVAGSALAAGMFLTMPSFLFPTPEAWQFPPDFPVPMPSGSGGFLVKDAFPFGAAAWSAGEAPRAARRDAGRPVPQTGGL